MGELWSAFCEDLDENWPHYNGTALYFFHHLGEGCHTGISLVVQYQAEISHLQDMIQQTMGRVEEIERLVYHQAHCYIDARSLVCRICHSWGYYPIPWLPTRLALASMATTSNVSSLSICIYVIMQFSFGDPWWYIAGNKLTSTGHFKMGGYTLLKSSCGYLIFKLV